jgi:zinc transport system permease protein
MDLLDLFHYGFMIRAFEAGIITAIIAPLIGIFLVTRRYSFLADTLSHVSLAGVAIGLITGTQPVLTALAASALTAVAVEELRYRQNVLGEAALMLFLSGGLALAAVLLSASSGLNIDLTSLLFGSIATVTAVDVAIIAGLGILVLLLTMILYKEFITIALDEELAAAGGLPVRTLNLLFVILAAVTVSLSLRIVGVLLIGALMIIPVTAAMQFQASFRNTLLLAVGISLFSVIAGLFLSYALGISSGGTIVLIALGIFLLSVMLKPKR